MKLWSFIRTERNDITVLDFYKELYLKINGIEPKEVLKPVEITKDEKQLFSQKTKLMIWILGIMYLIVAVVGIYTSIKGELYMNMIKYIFLISLDITSLFLVLSKNKKKQSIAIGTIFLFIVFNFSTTLL